MILTRRSITPLEISKITGIDASQISVEKRGDVVEIICASLTKAQKDTIKSKYPELTELA